MAIPESTLWRAKACEGPAVTGSGDRTAPSITPTAFWRAATPELDIRSLHLLARVLLSTLPQKEMSRNDSEPQVFQTDCLVIKHPSSVFVGLASKESYSFPSDDEKWHPPLKTWMTRILEMLTEGVRSMTTSSFPLISELKDVFPDPTSRSPLCCGMYRPRAMCS